MGIKLIHIHQIAKHIVKAKFESETETKES